MHTRLRLGITLGDPAGIGPEVVVRALSGISRHDFDVVVFGDAGILARTAQALGMMAPVVTVEEVTALPADAVVAGTPNAASAAAQVAYLNAGAQAACTGAIDALVTAPISKTWAARAGFVFPGHTEFLANAAGIERFAMMMAGPRLRTTIVTRHIAFSQVPKVLSPQTITDAILLSAHALVEDFGVIAPRVAVAGLNPHAGEEGRFGDEEGRLIEPAIRAARVALAAEDLPATIIGPRPPDAVFCEAVAGHYDVVVSMYHDQGLIPAKLLDFDQTVNVTLGLPFVRTSPDHGTAYALAGTGNARPDSLRAAIHLAAEMASRRRARRPMART